MTTSAQTAYWREVRSTARPYIWGIVITALVIGTLMGTIFYTVYSDGGSSDFKLGMTNTSLIAVVPTIIGARLAHKNFIADHSATLLALRNLGVRNGVIKRQFLYQSLVLALLAAVSAVVLGRLLIWPLLTLLLLGMDKTLPHTWGSPLPVFTSSLIASLAIYLIAVATLSVDRVLGELSNDPEVGVGGRKRRFGKTFSYIFAGVNVLAAVWILAVPNSTSAAVLLVLTSPILALVMATPVGKIVSRVAVAILRRFGGWNSIALGFRSATQVGTMTKAGIVALMVSIPMAAFTWVSVSQHSGAAYATEYLNDTQFVVTQDAQLLQPEQAESLCKKLGDSCGGVVYWQPSDIGNTGAEAAPKNRANDYTVAAYEQSALDEFVRNDNPEMPDNALHLDYMEPFAAVSQSDPQNPEWAVVLTSGPVSQHSGFKTVSTQQWLKEESWRSQLFFGPSGDGTAGILPLVAYTLLAICLVLAVTSIGKLRQIKSFFRPLHISGRPRMAINWTVFWAMLLPFIAGALSAWLVSLWYSAIGFFIANGRFGMTLPELPGGLCLLFVLVSVLSSATAFIKRPTAEQEA